MGVYFAMCHNFVTIPTLDLCICTVYQHNTCHDNTLGLRLNQDFRQDRGAIEKLDSFNAITSMVQEA